jgi:hypothetical protein
MSTPPQSALETSESLMLDSLVEALVQTRKAIAGLQAIELRVMQAALVLADEQAARLGDARQAEREMPLRAIAAEMATAVRVSDRTVQRQLSDASTFVSRFPEAVAALADGRISRSHLHVIAEAGGLVVDDTARHEYERRVLAIAENETAGRLRPIARILAERLTDLPLEHRHGVARATRGVRVIDLDDGMSDLVARMPSALAHGTLDRVTQIARAVLQAGELDDSRTLDEIRADVVADMLLTAEPVTRQDIPTGLGAIRATVQVSVPVLTLLGRSPAPGALDRSGPIDAETARALAGHARGWERVLTHPISGAVLAVDRYRPSKAMRRALRARDEHCRFPGCRMPARRCDQDHTIDHSVGGPTHVGNLAHLCRRHHSLKHASAWTVIQHEDGLLVWTSPTGRAYPDVPAPMVSFAASGDPPPF